MRQNAIVTLAIGDRYANNFERFCRRNWTAYGERQGFDVVVLKQPLDMSARAKARSPAWQKCLILSAPEVAGYERVVWVDSDIVINPLAPSILDGVPREKIGATDEHAFPALDLRQGLLKGIIDFAPEQGEFDKAYWRGWTDAGAWHRAVGLPGDHTHIVQTGVLVLSPQHHRGALEHVYESFDGGPNYEMRYLSHEILARGLQHWVDPRFNALAWWLFLAGNIRGRIETPEQIQAFVSDAYRRNYFLHFAGCANLMGLLGARV